MDKKDWAFLYEHFSDDYHNSVVDFDDDEIPQWERILKFLRDKAYSRRTVHGG